MKCHRERDGPALECSQGLAGVSRLQCLPIGPSVRGELFIGRQQINSFLNRWSGNKLIFFLPFDGLPCLTKSGGAEGAEPQRSCWLKHAGGSQVYFTMTL